MKKTLSNTYSILFLTGFISGYFSNEVINQLFYDKHILYLSCTSAIIVGSLFTMYIIKLSDDVGFLGHIKNYFSHVLLNISVIGANGLFLFLTVNKSFGSRIYLSYEVKEFRNIKEKYSKSADYYSLLKIKREGKEIIIRSEDQYEKEPKFILLLEGKGYLGVDFYEIKKVY